MRKFLLIFTILLIIPAILMNPGIANTNNITIEMQIDNPLLCINGEFYPIDNNNTSPVIFGGRTLLPIRAVIEALNGDISWIPEEKAVLIEYKDNYLTLFIDSYNANLNGDNKFLDTPPLIINGRTMLPIRFVAENLGFNVGWNKYSRTVTINNFTDMVDFSGEIPPYSGSPYAVINNNIPYFSSFDYILGDFEEYSELDNLNRCGTAYANICREIMPTEKRGSIGMIKPSGWHTVKYEGIDGKYLYNRCHLIGYQLAGENDNEKNLITGTRYLNVEGMLSFENKVADYAQKTGNHVLYRVSPIFNGDNLLCDGVTIEAYSIEDNGAGICFNVFCYNVQPGIEIDYKTGDSYEISGSEIINETSETQNTEVTYIGNKNTKKFHYPDCESVKDIKPANKEELHCTRDEAIKKGFSPCGRCKP